MTICLDVLVAKKNWDFLSVGKTFKGHQQIQENPIMHLLHMRCSIFLGCYMDIVTAETEKEILVTSHCFFSSGLSKKIWRTFRKSLISITKMLRNLKNQNILKGLWRFRSQHWSLGPSITQLFRYINGLLVVLVTGSTGYITPALKAIHVVCSIQKTTPVRGWKKSTQLVTKSWPEYDIIHFYRTRLATFQTKSSIHNFQKKALWHPYIHDFHVKFWYSPQPISFIHPPPTPQKKWEISISHGKNTSSPWVTMGFETKWASQTRKVAALDPWWLVVSVATAVSPMRTDLRQNTVFRERIDGGEP